MGPPPGPIIFPPMNTLTTTASPTLLDERGPVGFRETFGHLLAGSRALETAALKIRLAGVDLSAAELAGLERLRIVVAEVNARTVEEEAYALLMDPTKRENLVRILGLLRRGALEIRSAPMGGWSPDFSVFLGPDGPEHLLVGLHWFQRPFPHRGPAWAVRFGAREALQAHLRFARLWERAHDIGPAIQRLLERSVRGGPPGATVPRPDTALGRR